MRRLVLLCALGPLAAISLGGCVAIKSVTPSQGQPGSPVVVAVTVCASDVGADIDHGGCSGSHNAGLTDAPSGPSQVLLALRVPSGSGIPETLSGSEPEPGKPLSFTRSPSYEAELSALQPPGEGRQWAGWISGTYDHDEGPDGTPARESTIQVSLSLPPGANGGPFAGPLRYRVVVGGRLVLDDFPDSRPVECGSAPDDVFATNDDNGLCISQPLPPIAGDSNFAVRDFGLTAGSASASPGQSFNLPFQLATTGTIAAGSTVALSVTSTLPGAPPTPSPASQELATDLRTQVNVPVAVPADAGPGVQQLTLTAALPSGETRSATAQVTVRDRQKPVIRSVSVKPRRFRAKHGATLAYTLSEAAAVDVRVERAGAGRRVGGKCVKQRRANRARRRCTRWPLLRGSLSQDGGPGANRLAFKGRLGRRRLKPGRHRFLLAATDASGNTAAPVRAGFRIRRSRAR